MLAQFRKLQLDVKTALVSNSCELDLINGQVKLVEKFRKCAGAVIATANQFSDALHEYHAVLATLYPPTQPLAQQIATIVENTPKTPRKSVDMFSHDVDASVAGLMTVLDTLKAAVVQNMHIQSELTHYEGKLQKLIEKANPKDTERVARNKSKQDQKLLELAASNRECSQAMLSLDSLTAGHLQSTVRSTLQFHVDFLAQFASVMKSELDSLNEGPGRTTVAPELASMPIDLGNGLLLPPMPHPPPQRKVRPIPVTNVTETSRNTTETSLSSGSGETNGHGDGSGRSSADAITPSDVHVMLRQPPPWPGRRQHQ